MKFFVTGAAGLIGFHVSECLMGAGHQIVGIDNPNDSYKGSFKQARLSLLASKNFIFYKLDLTDREGMKTLFADEKFNGVIHLAAQARGHYSLENPYAYADANLIGHLIALEGCRHNKVQHLLYASSNSAYGLTHKIPFLTDDSVDYPVSLYTVTKKANELMSHTYSHLSNLLTTGLHFFTRYSPYSRLDMALFKLTKVMIEVKDVEVYSYGKMKRDFTYIDDIAEAMIRLQDVIPQADAEWTVETGTPETSSAPYHIHNMSNSPPVELMDYITALEEALGTTAEKIRCKSSQAMLWRPAQTKAL